MREGYPGLEDAPTRIPDVDIALHLGSYRSAVGFYRFNEGFIQRFDNITDISSIDIRKGYARKVTRVKPRCLRQKRDQALQRVQRSLRIHCTAHKVTIWLFFETRIEKPITSSAELSITPDFV